MQIYHYKKSSKSGDWEPFALTEEQGKLWILFCREFALKNPQDPNPYYSDYVGFIDTLNT